MAERVPAGVGETCCPQCWQHAAGGAQALEVSGYGSGAAEVGGCCGGAECLVQPGHGLVEDGESARLGFEGDQAHGLQGGGRHDEEVVVREGFPQLWSAEPAEVAGSDAGSPEQGCQRLVFALRRGDAQLDPLRGGQALDEGFAAFLGREPTGV